MEFSFFFPQGGFEPPQAEPESAVLPLHNRGMQCSINILFRSIFVKSFHAALCIICKNRYSKYHENKDAIPF